MKQTTRHSHRLTLVLCWAALTQFAPPYAHAQQPPAPTPLAPPPPIAAGPAEQPTDAAASAGVPPQAAAPAAAAAVAAPPATQAATAAPAVPPPAAVPAPAPAVPPPAATPAVAAPAHDRERPPAADGDEERLGRWMVRLGLGLQGSFIRLDGESTLRKPSFATLDFGYAPTSRVVLLLRVSSWLTYDPFAFQYLGIGASYLLGIDGMFVTGVIGLSLANDRFLPRTSEGYLQGLSAHIDLGQQWPLSSIFGFAVGAHFELGTPWLGSLSATHFGAGLFVALSWRDPIFIQNKLR